MLPDAALFDMDGLLVDSEPLWTVAEVELAGRFGGAWDDAVKAAVVGTRLDVAVPAILRHFGQPDDADTVHRTSAELLARMVELYADGLPLLPGAADLLSRLRAAGVPVALVSSSYRVLVDAVLSTGLGPFDLTLSGDEVRRGKPDPEPYLTAAAGLGVSPARCVVLEDAPSGVAAAEAAGCAVVAVPSVRTVSFAPGPRRLVLGSLSELRLEDLSALVTAPAA